jgi:amino acid transporter
MATRRLSSNSAQSAGPSRDHPRSLTFLNVVSLCVSLQIGAGLFAAPSQVTQFSPNPGTSVILWAVGGVLVWTGAATFIELGLRIPENGGVQEYLRASYGEGMGFVFAITWIVLTKPASMGIISIIFAEYLLRSCFPGLGRRGGGDDDGSFEPGSADEWAVKCVGFVGLAGLTVVNCLGAITGAKISNGFFVIKTLALISVIALGFGSLLVGKAHGVPEDENGWFGGHEEGLDLWTRVGRTVTALFGILYVYGGLESVSDC